MLCCVCKQKEAKVHLTQIADDKVQKVDLCEDCAKEKGVNDPTGFSLADLLLGLGGSPESAASADSTELSCPRCGFTLADHKKTGRLGCSDCYTTFAAGLGAKPVVIQTPSSPSFTGMLFCPSNCHCSGAAPDPTSRINGP